MKTNPLVLALAVTTGMSTDVAAQSFTFRVELDGVVGLVERRQGGALDSLVLLVPATSNPEDALGQINDTWSFVLNGLPWHAPVLEVENKYLVSGGSGPKGVTFLPLTGVFHEVTTPCPIPTGAPPQWASGSSASMLPALKVGGNPATNAKVDPAVLGPSPSAAVLAARWSFRCGEVIKLSRHYHNGVLIQAEPARLVFKNGQWAVSPLGATQQPMQDVAIERTVNGAALRLSYGASSIELYPSGPSLKVKLRNVPPRELLEPGIVNSAHESTLAHFRWLYWLAHKDHKMAPPYYLLRASTAAGNPFCDGYGTLLEP